MLYYMPYSRLIFTWLIFWVHFVKHFQPEVKTGEHHKMLYSSRPIKTLHFTLSYNKKTCCAALNQSKCFISLLSYHNKNCLPSHWRVIMFSLKCGAHSHFPCSPHRVLGSVQLLSYVQVVSPQFYNIMNKTWWLHYRYFFSRKTRWISPFFMNWLQTYSIIWPDYHYMTTPPPPPTSPPPFSPVFTTLSLW